MKKLMLVSIVSLFAASSAFANVVPTLSIQCKPKKAMNKALQVNADRLLEVLAIEGTGSELTMQSRVAWGFDKKDQVVVDHFTTGESPSGNMYALTQLSGSEGPIYNAAMFQITRMDVGMSAGPVGPGTYPGFATLLLVSEAPVKNGLLELHTAKIEMSCSYKISY